MKEGISSGGEGFMDRIGAIEDKLNIQKKSQAPPKRSAFDVVTGKKRIDKEFKIPLLMRIGEKQKLKKNYALVMWIKNNGYTSLDFAPIEDDFVYNKHSRTWHQATADYTLWYKKYPLLIIPEYSNIPYKPKDHAKMIEDKGLSSRAQKVLMEIQKKAESAGKKKFGGNILWLIIAGIVLLYFIGSAIGIDFG